MPCVMQPRWLRQPFSLHRPTAKGAIPRVTAPVQRLLSPSRDADEFLGTTGCFAKVIPTRDPVARLNNGVYASIQKDSSTIWCPHNSGRMNSVRPALHWNGMDVPVGTERTERIG